MRSKNFIIPFILLAFTLCLEMPLISSALNLQVIKGELSTVEQGEVKKIHAADHSIVTYHTFDVQAEEKVEIIQPNENSTLVILVDSNAPTQIKSQLKANGKVYLVNPKGIYIDKEAQIEANSLYLIGAESVSEDLTEVFSLVQSSGDIVNHGQIKVTNKLHLIGRHVVNSGLLESKDAVCIDRTHSKQQLAILHTGVIKAKDVSLEAKEGICEIYGKIDTKNSSESQYGGKISILANQVRLIGAYLDASGKFGGGIVQIGSSLDSTRSFLAKRTSIDNESIIDASAVVYGSGGEVIARSYELTSFNGEIYAKGGLKGGDGGLVITCSENQFGIYIGSVHVEASHGEAGSWLLEFLERKEEHSCLPTKK